MGDTDTDDKQVINKATRDSNGRLLPGNSGNLNGRPPKGHSITETIREMMTAKPEIKQALGSKMISLALAGDINAMRMIWNYLDGMPIQKNVLAGDEFSPIKIDIGSTLTKIYGSTGDDSTGEVSKDS